MGGKGKELRREVDGFYGPDGPFGLFFRQQAAGAWLEFKLLPFGTSAELLRHAPSRS